MKRKNKHGMSQAIAVNLLDLSFTPKAISLLMGKTTANIYAHLKNANRMKSGVFIRQYPDKVLDGTLSVLKPIFRDHKCTTLMLVAMGRAATPSVVKPPASATKKQHTKRKAA